MAPHWLCIRFPQLPLEIFSRSGSETQALVISDCERHASILLCNAQAQQAGIHAGMSVAAARALTPHLLVHGRNYKAEDQTLQGLAAWAYQFSSQISLYPPFALLLEIQGSARLFGGRGVLLQRIRTGLARLGHQNRLASAPTPLAAFCLARCDREQTVELLHELPAILSSLPLSVLDWEQVLLDRLQGMGVHQLGALLRLPRDGLARRFGPSHLAYLDRMLGRQPDPQKLYQPTLSFARRLLLSAEVEQAEALLFSLQRLLLELCGWLQGLGAGVRQLHVRLWHRQQQQTPISIRLRQASRDAEQLTSLLRERLKNLPLPEPVLELELRAGQVLALDAQPQDLFDAARQQQQLDLIDQLRARLGDQAVQGLSAIAEHRPEYAWCYSEPGKSQQKINGQQRPLWFLPVPRQLRTENGWPCLQGRLELQQSCERIESGWWDGHEIARDYFIARNACGSEYWIFREISEARRWFLQGVFE